MPWIAECLLQLHSYLLEKGCVLLAEFVVAAGRRRAGDGQTLPPEKRFKKLRAEKIDDIEGSSRLNADGQRNGCN